MNLDEGPIIAQDCFAVRPGMTLKQIVAAGQKLEAATLLKAVKLYLNKRLDVYWGDRQGSVSQSLSGWWRRLAAAKAWPWWPAKRPGCCGRQRSQA